MMIEAEDLGRTFKRGWGRAPVTAIQDLNLNVERGELFGLVGPDGAGKTTTLRILAGILKPSQGRASVDGHDVVDEAELIKQSLGYMPQQAGLYPDMTVDENLDFICDVFNVTGQERQKRLKDLLDFTQLHPFRDRRARQLSGGMQKKLGLTAALVHRPTLLLLDEPTTGVDPVARREFWDILTTLHADGSTVIVSTPYMDEAERCNRVGLMYNGRMMVCDTPAAIKRMLPGRVFTLRVADLNDLTRAVARLRHLPGMVDVQPYGDTLSLLVGDALREDDITGALAQDGVTVESLRPAPPRLEEAFIYFVRQFAEQDENAQSAEEVVS